MAIPFLNHLDLRSVSQLQNAILHKTTEANASNDEGKIIYDTGTNTVKYKDDTASGWIELTGDTNTWRPVTAGGNTLSTSETLAFTAGTNITITETGGAVTINAGAATTVEASGGTARSGAIILAGGTNVTLTESPTNTFTFASTDTNTNQLTTFVVEDGDGTEVTISQGKEWKFVEGGGIDINWTDTDNGTDGDPYDLTIAHADTSSQASVDNSSRTYIQDVTLDTYGHVTGLTSATESVTDSWRTVTAGGNTLSTSEALDFVAGANVTITESGGDVTIASSYTNTDTLQTISNDTTDAERFVTFTTSATGAQTAQSDANFKFNPGTDTLSVTNLVVSGTQTIKNETIQVVTDNTISFEGSTADAHEIHLTGADATADRTITLPDATGTVNIGYSTTVGGATTAEVTHSLGTRLVNVQLFDSSSYETVHADVVRTTTNTIDLTFAAAPGSGDVTVLVTRVA